MTRSRLTLAVAAALLAATAGCGTDTPPGTAVPALREHLSRVDAALQAREFAEARDALAELTRETEAARTAGRLTPEEADRIVAAASRLSAGLPEEAPEPAPTTTVTVPERPVEETTTPPEDDETTKNDEEQQDDEGGGNGEGGGNRDKGGNGDKGQNGGKGKDDD